jgi:transcriptional regulator with XRE-family HTH domain
MDARRFGLSLRAIRRRRGLRQTDVASRSGIAQSTVSLVERGHVERASVHTLEAICHALDATLMLDVRWRGASLDRLLDERHAALGAEIAGRLKRAAWEVEAEVTFAWYGERGSIDLLAVRPAERRALVVELKTELVSLEETLRRLDTKVRLAPRVVQDRRAWSPDGIDRLLVLVDSSTNRARARPHDALLRLALPDRNRAVARWLRHPVGRARGLWFVPISDRSAGKRGPGGPDRVRRSARASSERATLDSGSAPIGETVAIET